MAELVEFRVPAGSAQTLLVRGLEPEPRLEVSRGLGAGTGTPPGWGAGPGSPFRSVHQGPVCADGFT